MVMSNEEQIEEILMEAAVCGLRTEVLETAKMYMQENPKMDKVQAYEFAYCDWVK
jgi:hypothetical protein